MKETTRLLIEAGIIPESVLNMCKIWNGDEEDLTIASEAKAKTQEELVAVVKKVADLLEADGLPELREAEPDLEAAYKKTLTKGLLPYELRSGAQAEIHVMVGFSPLGKLLFKAGGSSLEAVLTGDLKGAVVQLENGRHLKILQVEPRYLGDKVSFYVCDVEELNA